nr:MAG TPA: hypothetical protein [Caudoviricetes sp.]
MSVSSLFFSRLSSMYTPFVPNNSFNSSTTYCHRYYPQVFHSWIVAITINIFMQLI